MKKLSISSIEKIYGGGIVGPYSPKTSCTEGVIGIIGTLLGAFTPGYLVDKGIYCIKGWFGN